MKTFGLLFIFAFVGVAQGQPKRGAASESFFADASKDIAMILAHPVFKKYSDYTIDNIRQGEIGESQAYFVRLVKPFASTSDGICLQFLGAKGLSGKPHACAAVE